MILGTYFADHSRQKLAVIALTEEIGSGNSLVLYLWVKTWQQELVAKAVALLLRKSGLVMIVPRKDFEDRCLVHDTFDFLRYEDLGVGETLRNLAREADDADATRVDVTGRLGHFSRDIDPERPGEAG